VNRQVGKAMVEYTKDDLSRATGIVEDLGTKEGRRQLKELEDGLSVTDLQTDAEQFYDDVDLLALFALDFPAMRLGDERLVPIALSEIIGPWATPLYAGREWRYWSGDIGHIRDSLFQEMQRGKARLNRPPTVQRSFENARTGVRSQFRSRRWDP
jgi:hypothetical protein